MDDFDRNADNPLDQKFDNIDDLFDYPADPEVQSLFDKVESDSTQGNLGVSYRSYLPLIGGVVTALAVGGIFLMLLSSAV